MIRNVHPGSWIRDTDLDFYPQRIPDPGVKKAPDPRSRCQKGTGSRIRKTSKKRRVLGSPSVSHQWCALFYRLLRSSTRHIGRVEKGERETQVSRVNEATVAWPEAIACRRPRGRSGVIKAHPPPPNSTFPWTETSVFQEKRLKSMIASF